MIHLTRILEVGEPDDTFAVEASSIAAVLTEDGQTQIELKTGSVYVVAESAAWVQWMKGPREEVESKLSVTLSECTGIDRSTLKDSHFSCPMCSAEMPPLETSARCPNCHCAFRQRGNGLYHVYERLKAAPVPCFRSLS